MKIQVFDPPMCCSTGVCGPAVDPELVRFATDVDWLKRQGVAVERFNLSQQPAAFVTTPVVKDALANEGNACLPLTLADGTVVGKGRYLTREVLAEIAGLSAPGSRPAAAKPGGCCCVPSTEGAMPRPQKRSSCC